MKVINFRILPAMLLPLVTAGCAVPVGQEKGGMPIIVAVEKSVIHANRDQVDGSAYMVNFAAESANGHTRAIHREVTGEYQLSVLRKLQGKRYWEVCYGPSAPGMFGSTYCYYLERSSY